MMNLMVDIETCGLGLNAAIYEASVVAFDESGEECGISSFVFNVHEQCQAGAVIDATWLGFFLDTFLESKDRPIEIGLRNKLESQLLGFKCGIHWEDASTIWFARPQFDVPRLERLLGGQLPWHYTRVRDLRTLMGLAKVPYRWKPDTEEAKVWTPHRSKDDCLLQIAQWKEAMRQLIATGAA